MKKSRKPMLVMVMLVLVLSAACAGSPPAPTQLPPQKSEPAASAPVESASPSPEQSGPASTEVAATTPPGTPEDPGAVSSLDAVSQAVVRIQTEGTFVNPPLGLQVAEGNTGSGFLIDAQGTILTAQHLVTGASKIQVTLAGEEEPRQATLLASDECADLALLSIEGGDLPHLQWNPTSPRTTTEVFGAGYTGSARKPEFTLNNGLVMQTLDELDSPWASVPGAIAHSVQLPAGMPGGPLLSADGRVLGVNYARGNQVEQNYAIDAQTAQEYLANLRQGQSYPAIGVNGVAVTGTMELDNTPVSGVWVRAVQPGSAAEKAGLQSGDIIYQLDDQVLAEDGTLATYCQILRSHQPGETIGLRAVRSSTCERLEGQLNAGTLTPNGSYCTGGVQPTEMAKIAPTTKINLEASQPGEMYLSTDFDDAEYWSTFTIPQTDNYEVTLGGSAMSVKLNAKWTSAYAIFEHPLPPDVRLDAGVETVSGPNRNNISLICRMTDTGWYEFSMNSGGYWYIWRYENGDYQKLEEGASYAINMMKKKNEITATCIGDELTFSVNGTRLGSATDDRFLNGGQVGVSVSTFDISGAGVKFHWFRASVPE